MQVLSLLMSLLLFGTGETIKGTGLEDLLSSTGLSTVGLSTAMCDVNYIEKYNFSGQVVVPVLGALLRDA